MAGKRILMGVIGRPHGVRGLVHVQSYAEGDLAGYALCDESGRAWTLAWRGEGIAELRDEAGRLLADRTAASRMTNVKLFVDREALPAPEADDFYLADLVGLAAFGPGGEPLGRVATVHDYGAGASLEIAGQGTPLLVPFTRACVPEVDVAGGRVTIIAPTELVMDETPPHSSPPSVGTVDPPVKPGGDEGVGQGARP